MEEIKSDLRIQVVAKELNTSYVHLVDCLNMNGYNLESKPTIRINREIYSLLKVAFARDKRDKKRADNITLKSYLPEEFKNIKKEVIKRKTRKSIKKKVSKKESNGKRNNRINLQESSIPFLILDNGKRLLPEKIRAKKIRKERKEKRIGINPQESF